MSSPEKTYRKWVMKYRDAIYNQALYFTGNRDDAADITQDVLMKLWINLESISKKTLRNWIITVTRNTCIDRSRKKRELSINPVHEDLPVLEQSDPGPSPEDNAVNREMKEALYRALRQLPEKYRTIFILREMQQYRYREIARALDISMSTVKVYLHRSRKILFDLLTVSHAKVQAPDFMQANVGQNLAEPVIQCRQRS